MSFFQSGFWIPSTIGFGARFLDTGRNFTDGLIASLICTLFSGIQICMCRHIIQLHLRLRKNQDRLRQQSIGTCIVTATSVLFTVAFIISALIYCTQFSRNVLALRSVIDTSEEMSSTYWPSYRGCTRSIPGRCVEVPLWQLQLGRRMELAYASLVQGLVFLTDIILVMRCYYIFFDRQWIFWTALSSLLASFGVSIFGLVALSRAGGLSGGSSWNFPGDSNAPYVMSAFITGSSIQPSADLADRLPAGYSPSMSIIASLVVNGIVTVAIVSRMIAARRRYKDSLPLSSVDGERKDDVYTSAAALVVESALPPLVFGIMAAVCSTPSVREASKASDFELIPKMAWVAFTALAPQLILVRILQGRALRSAHAFSSEVPSGASSRTNGSSPLPIIFSKDCEDDGNSSDEKRRSFQSTTSTDETVVTRRL